MPPYALICTKDSKMIPQETAWDLRADCGSVVVSVSIATLQALLRNHVPTSAPELMSDALAGSFCRGWLSAHLSHFVGLHAVGAHRQATHPRAASVHPSRIQARRLRSTSPNVTTSVRVQKVLSQHFVLASCCTLLGVFTTQVGVLLVQLGAELEPVEVAGVIAWPATLLAAVLHASHAVWGCCLHVRDFVMHQFKPVTCPWQH